MRNYKVLFYLCIVIEAELSKDWTPLLFLIIAPYRIIYFCSPNISEQLGKVHFPRFVQAAAPKYIGLFLFTFLWKKILKLPHSTWRYGYSLAFARCYYCKRGAFYQLQNSKSIMDLSEISAKICALMPNAKANKIKCTFQICTTSEGSQYIYFTVFFNDCGEEINRSLVFYEFQTKEQHTEKLEKIERFLNGEISAKELYNTAHFN